MNPGDFRPTYECSLATPRPTGGKNPILYIANFYALRPFYVAGDCTGHPTDHDRLQSPSAYEPVRQPMTNCTSPLQPVTNGTSS